MALIHLLQRFAALVSARDAVAVVVLAATFGTAVWAFYRAPIDLRRHRPALGAIVLGALVLFIAPRGWLPVPAMVCMALAVFATLTWHTFGGPRNGEDHAVEEPVSRRRTALWIGATSVLAAFFLLTDLGGYSGSLMIWEPESMRGLVEASKNDVSWPHFTASRLLWGQGLVSTGHDSLLFGSGTYALWQLVGVSSTTLRLTAAFLSLACLPVAYRLGMRIGGAPVARAVVVVIAVNPVLIFYGRYGVALSATLFSVLLLVLACVRLLDPSQNRWWLGLAAAGAAFLATLGYAPGRVVTVAVVTTTGLLGARSWRWLPHRRRLALALMVIVLAGVWLVQASFGTAHDFIGVRGEQVMSPSPGSDWVRQLLGDEIDAEHLTLRQRLKMAGSVIPKRVPQMRAVASFLFKPIASERHVIRRDPPDLPLIQGPLLLFAMWGFVRSLVDWRRGWPLLLAAALAAASLPILLTNRVDIHRVSLSALPIIVWAAMGLSAASHVMRECCVPVAARNVVAAILLVLVAADNSTFLFYGQLPERSLLVSTVQTEIDSIQEPVAVGVANDFRSEAEIQLVLLERQRLEPDLQGALLRQETVRALTKGHRPDVMTIVRIEGMLHDATLLLAPRQDFDAAISDLQARGMKARSIGDERTGMWRLDRLPRGAIPAVETSEPRLDSNPRPRRPRANPEQPVRRRLPLTEAKVRGVFHGFVPPRFHAAGDGEPITMDGATYGFGIGMHAWTHMLFYPPHGAKALVGVIGLADAVSNCDHALVTFEVWGEDDRRIFDSGPFSVGMAPRHISVPLDDASTITLAVTEAGNGHECDQAFWAEPFFTIAR
jgi:4-amino-4-deoxy-L-arabinose transferase-like glycosyltransferase